MDIKRITCIENLKGEFFIDTWGNLYKGENFELKKVKTDKSPVNGYMYKIFITKNEEEKMVTIHEIVANTFIPNDDPSKVFIKHKDGNRTNNCVDNLEWFSPSANDVSGFFTKRN